MGILEFVLLAVAVAIAAVLFMAIMKPNTFRVEREAFIDAPPSTVYAAVNEFRAWENWSPWAKKDPAMKGTYGAITAGVGASYGWDGNSKVGKGQMTIVEATPGAKVVTRLDFEKPFKATNMAEFTLRTKDGGTEVVWAMHGPATLMSKVMDVLMSMDKMIGRDFEAGLASLKTLCEQRSR